MSGGLLIWVASGDSITGCVTVGTSWVFQYLGIASRGDCSTSFAQSGQIYSTANINCLNMAVSGTHLSSGTDNCASLAPTYFDPVVANKKTTGFGGSSPVPRRKYMFSCSIGSNDGAIGGLATPAAYAAAVAAVCAGRKAAGYDLAMMTTLLPRGDGTMTEPNRLAYNSQLTTVGWAASVGVDFIVDFASDSIMGNPANLPVNNGNVLTWFNSDNIHPTTAGHARLVPILTPAMNTILAGL
jgi:hypothetical protein